MFIDHVIYGTGDLDETARELEGMYGLRFDPQVGRHPGGTMNRAAPIDPPRYVELLAVEEVRDVVAREAAALIEAGRTLLGWGVATDDVDGIAAQLGWEVEAGSVTLEDGSTGSWRVAASPDLSLPFFIAYDDPADDPDARLRRRQSRVREVGNDGFGGFTFVEVGAVPPELRTYLEGTDLPVRFVGGRAGLHAVGIAGPQGEIVIRDASS